MAGGLGNQLFQVVASYKLALAKNVDLSNVIFDTRFLGRYDSPHRLEVEFFSRYFLQLNSEIHRYFLGGVLSRFRLGKVLDHRFGSMELISSTHHLMAVMSSHRKASNYILDGYFQHPDLLFSELERAKIGQALLNDKRSVVESIKGKANTVGVHIRRGDYISSKAASRIFRTLPVSFYKDALDRLPETSRILVFSDDANISASFAMDVGGIDISKMKLSLQDEFCLLAACDNHVISNSTFSWWAAYLGHKENGRIISPRNWYHDIDRNKMNPLILPYFELIDN